MLCSRTPSPSAASARLVSLDRLRLALLSSPPCRPRSPDQRFPEDLGSGPRAEKRAAAGADAGARKARSSDEFAESSVTALRAVIGHLKTRSYRVVLLLTPLRRDRLKGVETAPLSKSAIGGCDRSC